MSQTPKHIFHVQHGHSGTHALLEAAHPPIDIGQLALRTIKLGLPIDNDPTDLSGLPSSLSRGVLKDLLEADEVK